MRSQGRVLPNSEGGREAGRVLFEKSFEWNPSVKCASNFTFEYFAYPLGDFEFDDFVVTVISIRRCSVLDKGLSFCTRGTWVAKTAPKMIGCSGSSSLFFFFNTMTFTFF